MLAPADGEVSWSPNTGTLGAIRGNVRAEVGELPKGLRVRIAPREGPALHAEVDEWGHFEAAVLRDESYTIFLHGPQTGYSGPLLRGPSIRADGEELELRLPESSRPSAFLTARVFDTEGEICTTLRATAARDSTIVPGEIDAQGHCRIGPLPPGRYFLTVSGTQSLAFLNGPWTLAAGEQRECGDFSIRPGGSLRVRLAGEPARVGQTILARAAHLKTA